MNTTTSKGIEGDKGRETPGTLKHWDADRGHFIVYEHHYDSIQARCDELEKALTALVAEPLRYNGKRIEIDCASHTDAMERVRKARAALASVTP